MRGFEAEAFSGPTVEAVHRKGDVLSGDRTGCDSGFSCQGLTGAATSDIIRQPRGGLHGTFGGSAGVGSQEQARADLHYSFMGATQIHQLDTKARELAGLLKADRVDAVLLETAKT